MARILITSGPTRQYLDPVRYLTNASSGRMGCALAEAALEAGHDVVIVSGPVQIQYPSKAEVVNVVSTEDMLEACRRLFPNCDGMIGVAAPCDYRPIHVEKDKIHKTGQPLEMHLIETPDVVATLGAEKSTQRWVVGFALETTDHRLRALAKAEKKSCDLMVLNGPEAMDALHTRVEVLDRQGVIVESFTGIKEDVARGIFSVIEERLIKPRNALDRRSILPNVEKDESVKSMSDAVVSLCEVADQIEMHSDGFFAFLNRKTGELFGATEEEMHYVEDEEEGEETDIEDLPPWQQEIVVQLREVLGSNDWITLPKQTDFEEYRAMERFILDSTQGKPQDELLDCIQGRGAFRRFKDAIHRHGIQEDWYRFRNRELAEFTRSWLESEGIKYREK